MRVKIIRISGAIEEHDVAEREIRKLICADCLDSVNLRNGEVMLVDDAGYETETVDHGRGHFELKPTRARKPVNLEATKLYWSVCKPNTTHQIVGDVAIARDADFA